jgi:hypothetical protein
LLIAQDPARHRPLMIPALLEKAAFGIAALVLFVQQQVIFTSIIIIYELNLMKSM